MKCNEVDELLGAYAADALDAAEAREVRAHLAGCAAQAAEERELRAVVARLAATVEPMTPPPGLRGRIVAAIDAAAVPVIPIDMVTARAARTDRRKIWAAGAMAAAMIVGLAVWNVALVRRTGGNDLRTLASRAKIVATLQAHGASGGGVVLYFPDQKKALVVGDGLTRLDPTAQTYQLWEINGGAPRSVGLMQADADGHAVVVVPFDGGAGQTLAITTEPAGGSAEPTTSPIFTTKI